MGNSQANSISTSAVKVKKKDTSPNSPEIVLQNDPSHYVEEKDPSPNSLAIVLPNDPSHYSVIDLPVSGFKWTIKNCMRLKTETINSEIFYMGGYKWFLSAFSSKSYKDQLALYLYVADSAALPGGWSINAKYSFAVANQADSKLTMKRVPGSQRKFDAETKGWGFASFMSLVKLFDQTEGFMVNDSIIVEVDVAVYRNVVHDSRNEDESSLELSLMRELRRTAMIYYNKVPLQVMVAVDHFFDALDVNKDGKVSFVEFSHFMREIKCESLNNPAFFEELSTEMGKDLNRNDVITLYYILKSGRPICDGCRKLIKGLFFTCATCFSKGGSSFNLHPNCLDKDEFIHEHAEFIDTFTLLSFTRMKILAYQNAAKQIMGDFQESSSSISPIVLNEVMSSLNSTKLSDDLPYPGFTWTIKNFMRLRTETIESEMFYMGGYKWFVQTFRKGRSDDLLSMHLYVADYATLPDGWSINAKFSFAVVNQVDDKLTVRRESSLRQFMTGEEACGFGNFMSLSVLFDKTKGFMVNDSIIVKVDVAVCRNVDSLLPRGLKNKDEVYLGLSSMKELRRTAMIYYNKVPLEVMVAINQIFDKMDINKDGKVSFIEFSHLMKEIGNESLNNHSFFEELSTEMSDELNRNDVITLYYILKSGRPICDGCRRLIKGLFFTCATCFSDGKGSFNLHPNCLNEDKFVHKHANFIDTFTLFLFTRMKILENQNTAKQTMCTSEATSSSTSSVILVEIEDPLPTSFAIVPGEPIDEYRMKMLAAFRILQKVIPLAAHIGSIGVSIGSLAGCTVM